jgi:hypothetical protein
VVVLDAGHCEWVVPCLGSFAIAESGAGDGEIEHLDDLRSHGAGEHPGWRRYTLIPEEEAPRWPGQERLGPGTGPQCLLLTTHTDLRAVLR